MQLLSAFSRPQTIPAAPATTPKKSLWILDSWRDLVLYVGTPLLLVPAFALAQARWSPRDIYLVVAPFGDVRYLVCDSGSAFAIPAERYARHVLYVWRAVYPGVNNSFRPTADSFGGHRCVGPFYPALRTDVARRAPAQSREIGSACYE